MATSRGRGVCIGAAGEMCRLAIERFVVAEGDWELALYDIRPELLDQLLQRLPTGLATAARLRLSRAQGVSQRYRGGSARRARCRSVHPDRGPRDGGVPQGQSAISRFR